MNRTDLIAGLLYATVGIVFFVLGLPLALGKVGPNPWYGFRAAKTFANQQTWYAANRVAGQDMMIGGGILLLGTAMIVLLKLFAFPSLSVRWCGLAAMMLVIAGVGAHGFMTLARL